MTGHIRRRGEHSWELKYDVGTDPATGRRRTRYATFKGNKRGAQIELAKLVAAAASGEAIDPSRMTVAEYLDLWERDWMAANTSPKTAERYSEILRLHVRPRIGALRIQKLRPVNLSELYTALGREAGLAARTIGHVHRVLHRALGHAVQWDLCQQNIATRVSPPPVPSGEVVILTAEQVRAVLGFARAWRVRLLGALALATGMRRGEMLALRWQDVDLDSARVSVARSLEQTRKGGLRFKEPKTRHGRRTIALPTSAVTQLRQHWREQQEQRLALGAGKSPREALIFADIEGQPWTPNAATKAWQKVADDAKMGFATLHSLRHTHASHLIAAGLDVLTISRRLGHGSPTITLAVYGHLFPQTDERAAQAIEAAIGAASTE